MILAALRSRIFWVGGLLLLLSAMVLCVFGMTSITPTITLVELAWTITALAGVWFSADFLRECNRDWNASGTEMKTPAEILGLLGFVLLVLHCMLLVLGIYADVNPLPQNNVTALVFDTSFTVMAQGLVGALFIVRHKRVALLREVYLKPTEET